MWCVGIRAKGEIRYRIVCKTYSRPYALRVARRYALRGYDVVLDEERNEEL